jgi:hypothetical protein
MMATNAVAAAQEKQLKELQDQVAVLQQQIALTKLQQSQGVDTQTALLAALKGQITAQTELDKARALGEFAKLAGIKAGLDSVGAPLGKDGTITVATGTAGALMLGLRQPMLTGLEKSAGMIAEAAKAHAQGARVFVATDAQLQAVFQAMVTQTSLEQFTNALGTSIGEVRSQMDMQSSAAAIAEIAGVGLVLNTLVGLEKFFRVDTTYSVFDSSDDALQILMSMLLRKFKDEGVDFRNLSNVSVDEVMSKVGEAQTLLVGIKRRYDEGSALLTEVEKINVGDPNRPNQQSIDRLRADLGVVKAALDALHPALKPEGFWAYVQGLAGFAAIRKPDSNELVPRLVVSAKAQVIQVMEKRTWRSDKIFGKSDIQVEYRLIDSAGNLLDSALTLATFSQDAEKAVTNELYRFPATPAPQIHRAREPALQPQP